MKSLAQVSEKALRPAWEKLGISAQKRKPELCHCLFPRFSTSTEPTLARDESLSFTNTEHVNKGI